MFYSESYAGFRRPPPLMIRTQFRTLRNPDYLKNPKIFVLFVLRGLMR